MILLRAEQRQECFRYPDKTENIDIEIMDKIIYRQQLDRTGDQDPRIVHERTQSIFTQARAHFGNGAVYGFGIGHVKQERHKLCP